MNENDLIQQLLASKANPYTGQFEGPLTPKKKKRTNYAPAAFQDLYIMTPEGGKINAIKCKFCEPTLEFPFPSIFLYFEGGGKTWFVRMSTTEFYAFTDKLHDWHDSVASKAPELEAKTLYYQRKQEELDKLAEIERYSQIIGNGHDDDFDSENLEPDN